MWIYEADLLFPATLRTLSSKSFRRALAVRRRHTYFTLVREPPQFLCFLDRSYLRHCWPHSEHTHTQCWVYLTDSIIHRVIKSSFRYNIFHSYWPAFATIRNTWHIDGRHTNTSISSGRNFGFVSSFSALWKCLTKSGTQFTGNFETWINNYMHGERVRVGYILANWSYTWAWRFEMDSHKHTKSCRHYRTRPMTDVCSFTCFPH